MKMRMCNWIIALILLATACVQNAQAAVRRVDKYATGSPINGSTWPKAYRDLQAALVNAPAGTDIWVAAETYAPGNAQNDSFALRYRVWIYGGFLGTRHPTLPDGETELGQRDFLNNLTILSGDIGVPGLVNDNCYCVVVVDSVTEAVLDGFTITGGNGGYWNQCGAGMYVTGGSSPTLANLKIIGNLAPVAGAGVYVNEGAPDFSDCRFENNRSDSGAALYLVDGAGFMTLDQCVFMANTAEVQAAALFSTRSEEVRV